MSARILLVAAAMAVSVPYPAHAWGKIGHRAVAAVADSQLSGLARAQVRDLLGAESLDEAATWPDEMRSDPAPFWKKTSPPWHYVTLNGILYDEAPPEGDALEALGRFSATLRNPEASRSEKQLALRFIVHIVGDLHQPLHVGKCCDRGGNEVKVKWFGRDLNLHSVWDTALVEEEQYSFTELAARLQRRTSSAEIIGWWNINPRDWISESAQLRETLYPPPAKKGAVPELGYDYVYRFTPLMYRRLAQAGVRLAAYLNAIYAEPQPVTAGGERAE
jgi:hypothetical protein